MWQLMILNYSLKMVANKSQKKFIKGIFMYL